VLLRTVTNSNTPHRGFSMGLQQKLMKTSDGNLLTSLGGKDSPIAGRERVIVQRRKKTHEERDCSIEHPLSKNRKTGGESRTSKGPGAGKKKHGRWERRSAQKLDSRFAVDADSAEGQCKKKHTLRGRWESRKEKGGIYLPPAQKPRTNAFKKSHLGRGALSIRGGKKHRLGGRRRGRGCASIERKKQQRGGEEKHHREREEICFVLTIEKKHALKGCMYWLWTLGKNGLKRRKSVV